MPGILDSSKIVVRLFAVAGCAATRVVVYQGALKVFSEQLVFRIAIDHCFCF